MNKRIILSIGAAALLASSLFAYGSQGGMKQGCKKMSSQYGMSMKKANHHKKDGRIMREIMMLDLTDKQIVKIRSIIADSIKDMSNPSDAFTKENFDKEQFVKLAKEKRDDRIEHKAEVIAKIYEVLDSSQKKDLKTILDMKDVMKKKMIKNRGFSDQYRNGRR